MATYIHCFFLGLINAFFICLVPYIHICLHYFLMLCFFFIFFFSYSFRHILQFTMFDSISLQPARDITEITLHSPRRKCRVNCNQNKYSNIIIFGTKYELFLRPYQITFFLDFDQAKILLSYQILMSKLITYYIVTKKSLNNIRYRKTFQNKKSTCFNKISFNKVLQKFCSWKFCKIHRKTPVLEQLFNKVAGIKRVHR